MGFLQPCILMQLSSEDRHGYDLFLGLGEFLSDAEQYDPSILYRLLREMEDSDVIESYEGEISRGPKRKMYRITKAGDNALRDWIDDLQRTREEIDSLLNMYKEQIADRLEENG